MLPFFLARFIARCAEHDFVSGSHELLSHLIRQLLRSVCVISNQREQGQEYMSSDSGGAYSTSSIKLISKDSQPLRSLTVAKWVFSTFSKPIIHSIAFQLGGCLTVTDLLAVKSYIQEKLGCSNEIVRNQVLSGLRQFLLCTTPPEVVGPPASCLGRKGTESIAEIIPTEDAKIIFSRVNLLDILMISGWKQCLNEHFDLLNKCLSRWIAHFRFTKAPLDDIIDTGYYIPAI
jgi:hypothetical protein